MASSETSGTYEIRFSFTPPVPATKVALSGDFWKWLPDAVPMEKQGDGSYAVTVSLPEGIHLYKFVIDGGKQWFDDPKNPNSVPDGFGGRNSVIAVGNAKFDPDKLRQTEQHIGRPVDFPVRGLPENVASPWIPVMFEKGELVYNPKPFAEGRGCLLLSREKFQYPPEAPQTSATIAPRPLFVYVPFADVRDREIYGTTKANPPRSKKTEAAPRFPVVYLHDGQNVWDDEDCCFGHGGWFLNRLMDEMTSIPRAILVGIPNSSARRTEYGLGDDILAMQPSDYLKFIVEVVKPRIDADFSTRPEPESTSLMGSSMGGLISIYGGYAYPNVFGNVAALSTAFWIPDAKGNRLIDVLRERGRGQFRLYIDSGTKGIQNDGVEDTRAYAKLAREKGWRDGTDFEHFEDVGAAHNERAWRARAWRPLAFILKTAASDGQK